MERLQSWVINTKWAIVQLYHGDYRVVEWLFTPSKQSFSCIMERLQSWWVIVNTKWAIVQLYHGEIRVEWLLTLSEQSFSCIMERLQSWVINTKWAIVQLYHGEITELLSDCWHQVNNRSAVSWRDYRVVEWLLTPSEQSFSCIMERLQSWVINNTEWAIVQLYHGDITELSD